PAGREWTGFGFAIADYTTHQQIRIVERRARSMAQRISQLASFMDRARSLRRVMAGNPAREGKLFEQPPHAFFALLNIGIKLAIRAFEIGIGDHAWPAVSRAADVNRIKL